MRKLVLFVGLAALSLLSTTTAAANGPTPSGPPLHCVMPHPGQPAAAELNVKLPPCKVEIGLAKTVSDPAPLVGAQIQWTITVTNTGAIPAAVRVTDVLPAGNLFVSETHSVGGLYDSVTGLWNVGVLLPGHSGTLVLTVIARAAAENCALAVGLLPHLTKGTKVEIGDVKKACASETPHQPSPSPSPSPSPTSSPTPPLPSPSASPTGGGAGAGTPGLPNTGWFDGGRS